MGVGPAAGVPCQRVGRQRVSRRLTRAATRLFATATLSALSAVFLPTVSHACDAPPTSRHNAIRIIDPRTIELDDKSTIKLSAILPPTRYDSPAAPTEFKPEQTARAALEDLINSNGLAIARERDTPDRYGRIVAHVFLSPPPTNANPNTSASANGPTPMAPPPLEHWLQARLVSAGHARVALTPETTPRCARHLLTLEANAEKHQRGLWREALYQAKPADDPRALLKLRSTFQIVTGTVFATAVRKSAVYLNFAEDWQRDFTVRIAKSTLKRASLSPDRLRHLSGRTIRVRGWIERRGGPLITVWRLEQIEIISQEPSVGSTRPTDLFLATDLETVATPPTRLHPADQTPGNKKAPAPK